MLEEIRSLNYIYVTIINPKSESYLQTSIRNY
jgi:hypothetical protein